MAKEIVTLYIDDASIRLLVTHGTQIIKWAELLLEPGQVKNAVVIEEAEIAAKITQLFEAQKIRAKKVTVGVSGLHCPSRIITLPQLPKAMLDEAVMREAKRVLPVPLEQVYLSWQTIPAPEGRIQIFLVAVPHQVVDALIKTLHKAGVKPDSLDLKPLLLARLVKEVTTVIVNIQPTEFDIIILVDGIVQPTHTISFSSESLSLQDKLPLIRDEIDRTIKFYNSNNPEKLLDSSVPIFTSIALVHQPELCQYLSDKLGRPVLSLPSPLMCPQGLDPNRYMVNIGLALKTLSLGEDGGLLKVNLNVLPTAYLPKPISLTKVSAWSSTAAVIGLFIFLAISIQSASADITSMRSQLDTNNQLLQREIPQREELMKNITEAETSYNNFNTILDSLDKQNNWINDGLGQTVDNLPSTISLSSISQTNSILTIKGRSQNEREILLYLTNLDASDRFAEITITSIKKVEGEGIDFALVLRVRDQG